MRDFSSTTCSVVWVLRLCFQYWIQLQQAYAKQTSVRSEACGGQLKLHYNYKPACLPLQGQDDFLRFESQRSQSPKCSIYLNIQGALHYLFSSLKGSYTIQSYCPRHFGCHNFFLVINLYIHSCLGEVFQQVVQIMIL